MNLPNRLTVGRLFLTIFFVAALSASFLYQYTLSLGLFVLAAATDYVDGEIARRYSLVTDFGKLMDPLVDKIMTTAAFVCLVPLRAIPAWVAIVVITREFLITGLRLLAVSQGRILAADPIGKHKTSWQIATVVFFLGLLTLQEWHIAQIGGAVAPGAKLWSYGGWAVSGIAVVLTIYSGLDYLWRHRAMLKME